MNPSERRFALRHRTHAAHERLDAAVGAFSTPDQYRRYVTGLSAFRATMDGLLSRVVLPADWNWQPTAVISALRADCADLGLPAPRAHPAPIDLASSSALLGALYVLEGSALGARVLKTRAADLGFTDMFGGRHLAAMSNDIAQWRGFLLVLDRAEPFDINRAALSADAVFALALRCFESDLLALQ